MKQPSQAGPATTKHVIARRILLRLINFGEGRSDTRQQPPRSRLRDAADESLDLRAAAAHGLRNTEAIGNNEGKGGGCGALRARDVVDAAHG
jgi:hypothetical protein